MPIKRRAAIGQNIALKGADLGYKSTGFMLLSALFVLMICAVLSAVLVQNMVNSSSGNVVNHVSLQAGWLAESSLEFSTDIVASCNDRPETGTDLTQLRRLTARPAAVIVSGQQCELTLACKHSKNRLEASVACTLESGAQVLRTAYKDY